MTLEEYARQQRSEAGSTPPPPPAPAEHEHNPIAAAQKIIADYKFDHEVAEGCRLQILQDIENKVNPFKLLLYAAEAISRLDRKGDGFFLQVQSKLIEVYGADITEPDKINL